MDVSIGQLTGVRASDYALANATAGLSKTPKGYTWHHHEDLGRMQLVKTDIHQKTGHSGGFSIYSKALAVSAGISATFKSANAGDVADFAFDMFTPFALTSQRVGDSSLDGYARGKGFSSFEDYRKFQIRLNNAKKKSNIK